MQLPDGYHPPAHPTARLFHAYRPVIGSLVAVMTADLKGRDLSLEEELHTRALRAGEIHEAMLTLQDDAAPGVVVSDVTIVGFFEILQGGLVRVGDPLYVRQRLIGHFAGYDEGHMPNHWNMAFKAWEPHTGLSLECAPGDAVVIGAGAPRDLP